MAYVEVWKSGKLITRRRVDESKARKGCRVRLGSAGEVRVAIGQSETLGELEVRMFAGEPPPAWREAKETASIRPHDEQSLPSISMETPGLSAEQMDRYPNIEGYKIIEPLGEGGMGIVWRAEQLSTRRQVALKLMVSHRIGSSKSQARFQREVELTARLDHPNIARIYDSGLHRGMYYYAMELIDGVPLDQYVKSKALSQVQILVLMRKVCQALLFAHLQAVIHRDLKPSNILVSSDGQPHVLDFGLAKALLEENEALTISVEGQMAGTPAYMSPEQAAGHHSQTDTRTDVFSLGVILYELLTGQSPYDLSGSTFDVLHQITEGKIQPPRELNKSIDRELEAILLKALAQEPDGRYASAGTLAKDISNYLVGNPLTAWPESTAYRIKKFARKHAVPIAGLAAVFIVLLAGLATTMYFRAEVLRMEAERTREREATASAGSEQERDIVEKKQEIAEEARVRETVVRSEAEQVQTTAEEQRELADKNAESSHRALYSDGIHLADFEASVYPKWDYGIVDAGSIEQEQNNHFFRFAYSRENTANYSDDVVPHAGYSVDARNLTPQINSVLVFRYRTNGISDLQLSLRLSNQRLMWSLYLSPASEWRDLHLPLRNKLSQRLEDVKVESLHLTTFARIPVNVDELFLDLDDFRLEVESLSNSEVQRIESELSKHTVDEEKLKEYLRIQNLRTNKSTYTQGEEIIITYDVVNQSDTRLDIPLNTRGSSFNHLIGVIQYWIEPIDESAKATDFGRAFRREPRYAAGGHIFPIDKNYLAPRERLHRKSSLRLDLKPGRYRYYIEMKAIDDDSLINEVVVELIVGENTR